MTQVITADILFFTLLNTYTVYTQHRIRKQFLQANQPVRYNGKKNRFMNV